MAETTEQRYTRYQKESEETLARMRDFGVGVLKGVTTDLPGFLMDVADKLSGDTAVLGERDNSAKLFKKLTGIETTGTPQQKLGEVTNPGAILKAMMVPAFMVKGLPAVREATRALAKDPRRAEEIFRETGIFASPSEDGVLRAVIDDSAAQLNINSPAINISQFNSMYGPGMQVSGDLFKHKPLPEVLDHPELYAAIPSLRDTKVGAAGFAGYQSAFYNADRDYIGVGTFQSPNQFTEALLHEIQHAVQTKTGLSQGGNPDQFVIDKTRLKDATRRLQEMMEDSRKAVKIEAARTGKKIYMASPEFANSSAMRRMGTVEESLERLREVDSMMIPSYKRIAGEAEARATERMFREGAGKYPLSYYDVPMATLIESAGDIRKLDDDPVIQAIINSVLKNPKPISPAKK